MGGDGDGNEDILTLYVRSGFDGKKYGACPACQRVFMVLMMRAAGGAPGTQFLVATVPPGRPPLEFKRHGLRNLPAVISCGEGLDTVEEIIDFIAVKPDTATHANNVTDTVATDFFSKFCFFIKSMSRDSRALEARLEAALSRLDQLLASLPSTSPFLAGPDLGQLDCELLPKLHHVRVAASVLRGYHIPASLSSVWRYLHHGYNHPVFRRACPPDQEIVLHWADRPDTPSISLDNHSMLTREIPKFSFDIPAVAVPVNIDC